MLSHSLTGRWALRVPAPTSPQGANTCHPVPQSPWCPPPSLVPLVTQTQRAPRAAGWLHAALHSRPGWPGALGLFLLFTH